MCEQALVDGISVLAHCSDGWDRTAQTCALALVLIDPHYRTLDGFQVIAFELTDTASFFDMRCRLWIDR